MNRRHRPGYPDIPKALYLAVANWVLGDNLDGKCYE